MGGHKMKETIKNGVPKITKLLYGTGVLGDTILYTVFYIYFLFFLTDVAKISPGMAGTISMIGILWDAITDPLVGSWSDNSKLKSGRRRPFILAFAIPFGVSAWLLFSVADLEPTMSKVYYIVMVIIFFSCYTGYAIPYAALGAEISQDYDERTSIQSYKGSLASIGAVIGTSTPMLLMEYFRNLTGSINSGWAWMAATLGGLTAVFILISWVGTKGWELKLAGSQKETKILGFLERYKTALSNRPYRYIIAMYLISVMGSTMSGTIFVYFSQYYLGFDIATMSLFFALFTGSGIVFAPLVNYVTQRIGKRAGYMVFMGFFALIFSSFMLAQPGDTIFIMTLGVLGGIGLVAMWIISWSMISDATEVDEWHSGQRQEGLYFGFAQLIQKGGAAITMSISGWILSSFGYVPNVEQSAKAILGIRLGSSLFCAIPLAISVIICYFYPLSEQKHSALREAIEARKEGRPYSTDGFKDLI